VEHTVQDVVTTMQTLAKKDFNTLAVDCPDAVGSVRADVTKIRQGLFKLLSNAGKFTEQGNITLPVTVTVTDDDAGEVTTTYESIVFFDSSAGFATGGGWIDSPAGAYTADSSLSGKSSFGLVAKYKNGANTPDDNTESQFRAAGFNFHSTDYQFLMVAGAKTPFKGTVSVNGVDGYGFLLTGIDGKVTGGGGIVYDNDIGASDDINSADQQELIKGYIVIHK
jgi:hypothetical protein